MCRLLKMARTGCCALAETGALEEGARRLASEAGDPALPRRPAIRRESVGAPRMHALLVRVGCREGRNRVARLMREFGTSGSVLRKSRSSTLLRKHTFRSREVVRGNFRTDGPDRVWFSDTTRIDTREGPCQLAVMQDGCTQLVVGLVGVASAGGEAVMPSSSATARTGRSSRTAERTASANLVSRVSTKLRARPSVVQNKESIMQNKES